MYVLDHSQIYLIIVMNVWNVDNVCTQSFSMTFFNNIVTWKLNQLSFKMFPVLQISVGV